MNSPQFHQTIMGRKFFEGTMPGLSRAVQELSKSIKERDDVTHRLLQELGKKSASGECEAHNNVAYLIKARSTVYTAAVEGIDGQDYHKLVLKAGSEEQAVNAFLIAEAYDGNDIFEKVSRGQPVGRRYEDLAGGRTIEVDEVVEVTDNLVIDVLKNNITCL